MQDSGKTAPAFHSEKGETTTCFQCDKQTEKKGILL